MASKQPSALDNPILSQALDTHLTEMATATVGSEFAEMFVPLTKDLLLDQNSPTSQAFVAHLHRLTMDVEVSVKQDYSRRGIKVIALTDLEVAKLKAFANRLQDRNDKDIAKYFEFMRQLLPKFIGDEFEPDDAEWEDIIKEMQSAILENASRLQPENLTGSVIKTLRSCGTYYIEELTAMPGSSVEYDPIFSLPPGVQPSEVLKIRMSEWQGAKTDSSLQCRCAALKNPQVQPKSFNLAVAVKRPNIPFVVFFQEHSVLVSIARASPQLPCITNADPASAQAVAKIFKCVDAFINKLFSSTSQEMSEPQTVVDTALRLIQELVDSSLFKVAVPLLVTLLHGTVTLTVSSRSRAYKFLVESLRKICEREDIPAFEKWLLKATCEYIPTQGELTDLPTTLSKFLSILFTEKSKELVSEATSSACSKRGRSINFILEPIISLYVSQIGLLPAQRSIRSVVYYLKGLLHLTDEDKSRVLNNTLTAAWLNSELLDPAAKVFAHFPPRDRLSMLNITAGLVIPPEECNLEVYKLEKEIKSKIVSKKMSHYDAALWYLDLMVMEKSIRYADEKVFCILKAAQHLAYEFSQVANDQPRRHALQNAVIMLAYDASQLATTSLLPGLRIFAVNTAYQLTHFVSQISDPTQHSCLSGRVAIGLLRNLHHSAKFTFLVRQPMTADDFWVAAAPYIMKFSSLASSAYIQQLLQIPDELLPMKRSLLLHHVMEVCYRSGHVQQPHFQEKRIAAMSALLSETQWKFEDVTKAMSTDMFQRTDEGFIKRQKHLCKHFEIAELKGIVFNDDEKNPSIHVIIKPAEDGNGVLSYKDIIELLQLTVDEASTITFSLDPPSGTEKYHPFMTLKCFPTKLQDTDFMRSLFHADYLLKFFSTGVEVSAKYPYNFKPVQESLIKDLPETLNFLQRPPYTWAQSHMARHRFWIEIEEVTYDEIQSKNQVIYYIGEVKVQVKSRPMVVTLSGNTMDAKHSEEGPHAWFARQLTHNYEELSKSFPIFARVKELSKLQFLAQKHHAHLQSLEKESPKLFESASKEIQRLHLLHPLESNPDSCLWVPATFNNLVYGGVRSNFKSCHLNYLKRPGVDVVADAHDAEPAEFSDAYKLFDPLRKGEGGIKIQLNRLLKTHLSREELETEYTCVKLGDDAEGSPVDKPETAQGDSEQDTGGIPAVVQQPRQYSDVDTTGESSISKGRAGNKIAHQESPENSKERMHEPNDAQSKPKPESTPTNQMNDKSAPTESVQSTNGVQKEPDSESRHVTEDEQAQDANIEEQQPHITVEFDIDSIMSLATSNQISFERRGEPTDSLLPRFSQSLLNKAIFGETLNDQQLKRMLQSTYNFDEINFHPSVLACHLIKTAIVLRKIVEYHYKRGTARQIT